MWTVCDRVTLDLWSTRRPLRANRKRLRSRPPTTQPKTTGFQAPAAPRGIHTQEMRTLPLLIRYRMDRTARTYASCERDVHNALEVHLCASERIRHSSASGRPWANDAKRESVSVFPGCAIGGRRRFPESKEPTQRRIDREGPELYVTERFVRFTKSVVQAEFNRPKWTKRKPIEEDRSVRRL